MKPTLDKSSDQSITKDELVESYDILFSSPGKLRDSDALYRWVIELLDLQPGQTLLDIGCGEGILLRHAEQRGVNSIGVDLSFAGAKMAKNLLENKIIALGDGENLPFGNQSFDFATNIGGLEHFLNPDLGLDEMRRILRPGGYALLILPNSHYLVDIIWQVMRTGYSVSHKQALERFATFREWWDFIESHGFRVNKADKYNLCFPRSSEDWRWYRAHPRKILNLLVSPLIPFNLSYHFIYICTPN
jgi:ubiquinone/menaquinone biosynthesis C-methylase UbiE